MQQLSYGVRLILNNGYALEKTIGCFYIMQASVLVIMIFQRNDISSINYAVNMLPVWRKYPFSINLSGLGIV